MPNRARYLRTRSASFGAALRVRDTLNNRRPASERLGDVRQTRTTSSDEVFRVIADFAAGRIGGGHWVGAIEAMRL